MSVLSCVTPNLHFSGSVAVVGSNPRVIGTGCGLQIDSSDFVVRFNRAPTEGFENDVGSRTDVRVTNDHVFRSQGHRAFKVDIPFMRRVRDTVLVVRDPLGSCKPAWRYVDRSNTVHRINKEATSLVHRVSGMDTGWPTMGYLWICLLVDAGIKPVLYAWSTDNETGHYWEHKPQTSPHHKISTERAGLRSLLKRKLIKMA